MAIVPNGSSWWNLFGKVYPAQKFRLNCEEKQAFSPTKGHPKLSNLFFFFFFFLEGKNKLLKILKKVSFHFRKANSIS